MFTRCGWHASEVYVKEAYVRDNVCQHGVSQKQYGQMIGHVTSWSMALVGLLPEMVKQGVLVFCGDVDTWT